MRRPLLLLMVIAAALLAMIGTPSLAQGVAAPDGVSVAADSTPGEAPIPDAEPAFSWMAFFLGAVGMAAPLIVTFIKSSRYASKVNQLAAVLWEGSEAAQAGLTYFKSPTKANMRKAKSEFTDMKIVTNRRRV